jgi:hypothetical protein
MHNSFWNSFATPVTSAALERVFSITNVLLDEKNSFLVEIIKAVIVTKTHLDELLYNVFYALISNSIKITSGNMFIYEVQNMYPRGKNNSFIILLCSLSPLYLSPFSPQHAYTLTHKRTCTPTHTDTCRVSCVCVCLHMQAHTLHIHTNT